LPVRPTVHSAVLPAVTPDSATDFFGLNVPAPDGLDVLDAVSASLIVISSGCLNIH
jgi:hypothetical protein